MGKYLTIIGLFVSIYMAGCSNIESKQYVAMNKITLPKERLAFPVSLQAVDKDEEFYVNPLFAIDIVSVMGDGVIIEPRESHAYYDANIDGSTKKLKCDVILYEISFGFMNKGKAVGFAVAKDLTEDNWRHFIYTIPLSVSNVKIKYRLRTSSKIYPKIFTLSFELQTKRKSIHTHHFKGSDFDFSWPDSSQE